MSSTADLWVTLGYALTLLSAVLCVVYSARHWNQE